MGQANWYMKKLARQQNLRIVKSREKAATDAEFAAFHGGSTVGGPGQGVRANGHVESGCLHHSASVGAGLSGLRTGEADDAREGRNVELLTMEAGQGSSSRDDAFGSRQGGGGGVGVVGGVPVNNHGGCRGDGGNGGVVVPLKRLGKQTVTTGDLVNLCAREEEIGPLGGARMSPGSGSGSRGGGGGGGNGYTGSHEWGGGLLPRRASEGVNMAQIRLREDRWSVARSFKVLGVEIGHLGESQQFMVCAGGVFAFLLVYGYMQVSYYRRFSQCLCTVVLRGQ